jgi:microcystin degradation protein MlrC
VTLRIAICGILSENNTFTLDTCDPSLFTVLRGAALLDSYDWPTRSAAGATGPLAGHPLDDVEWIPVLRAQATAAGEVRPETWDGFLTEILDGLRAAVATGPVDGVYLDIHGAVKVRGRDEAEETLADAVRAIVGPSAVLSASMDPHGTMSRRLATTLDLATSFRQAPHVDVWETRERAVRNLLTVLRGDGGGARGGAAGRPVKAWVPVPVLLPGERTSTLVEPGRTVFGSAERVAERDGILDAAMWLSFAWSDEPRNSGSVLVTGTDRDAVVAGAEELARIFWDARADFALVADHTGSLDEALDFVEAGAERPVWISDAGDNTTAGGSGDLTVVLHAVRDRPSLADTRVLIAPLVDPATVSAAVDAARSTDGPAVLDRAIGAAVDSRFAGPVPGPWTVERLIDGHYDGEGVVGALLTQGHVGVVVQTMRSKFTPIDDRTIRGRTMPGNAWIDPSGWDVVVVKNGYLFPTQTEAAASWFMASTPGGTDLDPARLPFERVGRPVFPLDTDFAPDLSATILP